MSEKSYQNIIVEKADGITWVTLNRPEKRNAMSPQLHYDMDDALAELAVDEETKVLVLTGAGAAFSAGQDLQLYFRDTAHDPAERRRSNEAAHSWFYQRLTTFPKPTIAMVNGYCFGGGLTPVCACDFAIAAEDALFGLSEINWGILPGGYVSWQIANVMSFRDAMHYAVSGETFDGKKAAELRFVTFAVPREELRQATIDYARMLMAKNPAAVRFTKEAIRAVKGMPAAQALDYLRAKGDALKGADDEDGRAQGMSQFLDEKSYRPGLGPYQRRRAKKD
ncbi:MAG: p-hydroxycinnamoyl CoA hydratase/lyase [Alphaproteobacteria bacterium]|nr:MAG: p-hydroxycinnamoyl CoA hydratase/lyase [Alphaproteobacteria bacterium]